MKRTKQTNVRILAIAPSSRGFGYAVLEEQEKLVDWGVKCVQGDKNAGSLAKVEKLIAQYEPLVLVLEDTTTSDSRRAPRIRELSRRIIIMASSRNVGVALFSRQRVVQRFFHKAPGTKHALAKILARRFPEELGFRLPLERRPWMSEDYRMDIFDAVALALTHLLARSGTRTASMG